MAKTADFSMSLTQNLCRIQRYIFFAENVDDASCKEEKVLQFSVFHVDRNSTFPCQQITFDDQIKWLNNDNSTQVDFVDPSKIS